MKKLYHGTCRAFLAHAILNQGKFGPEYDSISFTPQFNHAKMFSKQWQTKIGINRLEKMFGKEIDKNMASPIILELNKEEMGELKHKEDCGAEEYYLEKGPLNIDYIKKIYFQERLTKENQK